MKIMRIVGKINIFAVLILIVTLFSREASAETKIGVLMFSGETRYTEATRGFLDKLREEGFREPRTKFIIAKAAANKAKAMELVRDFAAAKMDLIFTLGTSITIPVSREIKDVPIVFSVIYDPIVAGIAKDWKSSGNNTTGVSSKLPMSKLMDILKEFTPVKRLAVLYTPGEQNSETAVKDLQAIQSKYGIEVIPVPLTKKEEVALILPEVIRSSDAIYVTGSNLVDSQISDIVKMANKAGKVTISHLEDLVEKGALLGVCVDTYSMGRLAGAKAVKILRGAKPSSLPIETMKEYDLIINMKTAQAGAFRISHVFMTKVTKKIK
jgi:putative tryptophan/tyrosine transport system substrate-binding protein